MRRVLLAVLLFLSIGASGQTDGRKPGIYTLVGGESVELELTYGGSDTCLVVHNGSDLCPARVRYRGLSSGVIASRILVYVIDPESNMTFDPFNKWMNPKSMVIVRLKVDHGKAWRELDFTEQYEDVDFRWEESSVNSFMITLPDLSEGEYAVVFNKGKIGMPDWTRVFCFTVQRESQSNI